MRFNNLSKICECYQGYMIRQNGPSENCVIHKQELTIKEKSVIETSKIAGKVVQSSIFLSGVASPALFLKLIDILQVIKYILFVNVTYPRIVDDFIAIFAPFDFEFLKLDLVPQNYGKFDSPKSFKSQGVDSLWINNCQQYVFGSLITLSIYSMV